MDGLVKVSKEKKRGIKDNKIGLSLIEIKFFKAFGLDDITKRISNGRKRRGKKDLAQNSPAFNIQTDEEGRVTEAKQHMRSFSFS